MPIIRIDYDTLCEDPIKEAGELELILFRNHDDWGKYFQLKNGEVCGANLGVERRLNCSTAFAIDKYEHSGVVYSLRGEGMQCQWDTSRWAGILLVKDTKSWRRFFKTQEERDAAARSWLKEYSDWANGTVFEWTLTFDEDTVESCGGYIGWDSVPQMINDILGTLRCLQQEHPEATELKFEGEVDLKDDILKALAKERADGQPVLC